MKVKISKLCVFFIAAFFCVIFADAECHARPVEFPTEIVVRIDESAEDHSRLEQEIRALPGVTDVLFYCRDEVLEKLLAIIGEEHCGMRMHNPLRDSFIISIAGFAYCHDIKQALSDLHGVAQVDCHCVFARAYTRVTRWVNFVAANAILILTKVV